MKKINCCLWVKYKTNIIILIHVNDTQQSLTLLGSTFLLAIKWSPAASKSSTVLALTNCTNANPLDCPENGSVLMLMFSISPYWVKYSRNSFSLMVLPRPPTNSFLSSSRPGPVALPPLAFGCCAMSCRGNARKTILAPIGFVYNVYGSVGRSVGRKHKQPHVANRSTDKRPGNGQARLLNQACVLTAWMVC